MSLSAFMIVWCIFAIPAALLVIGCLSVNGRDD
jgi:hypothetical protein